MRKHEVTAWLVSRAREYAPQAVESVNRNSHANDTRGECTANRTDVEAILVDFVNFCGHHQGVDVGMNTSDLRESEVNAESP